MDRRSTSTITVSKWVVCIRSLGGGYVGGWVCLGRGGVCEGVGMSEEGDRYVKGVGMSSGGLGMSWMGTHRPPQTWDLDGDWVIPVLTSSGGHQSRRYASYWNAFLLPPANKVWGKVIFQKRVSRILFTGGEYLGRYPPGPGTSPTRYTPWDHVHPPEPGTPLGPGTALREQCMHGDTDNKRRYASYWNAFLFIMNFQE